MTCRDCVLGSSKIVKEKPSRPCTKATDVLKFYGILHALLGILWFSVTLKGSARSLSYSLSSTFSHSSALFSSLGRLGNHLSSIVFPLSGGRKTVLWNWKLLVVVLMSSLCIDHFLQILSKAYFDWIWADENRIVNCVQSYWERRKLWTLMWTLMCMVISLTLYTPEKVACQILT